MLDTVEGEGFRRQFQRAEQRRGKLPLVGEIMNGDDRGWPGFFAIVKISCGKAALPIMGMHHIGHEPLHEAPANGGGNLTERGEAKGVIRPVGAARCGIGVSGAVIEVGRVEDKKLQMCRPAAQKTGAAPE